MASFTFDRPLKLTPEGAEKFFEIAMTPAKPDGIEPYSDEERKEADELLEKFWWKEQNGNNNNSNQAK